VVEWLRHGGGGFTAVEMLVASVVMSFTLLGVVGVFRQALHTEAQLTGRATDRAQAAAVADAVVRRIEAAVWIEPDRLLRGLPSGSGGFVLTGWCAGYAATLPDPGRAAWQRYRLVWIPGENDGGRITLQTLPYAGTADLSRSADQRGETNGRSRPWQAVRPVEIARGIARFSLQFRASGAGDLAWTPRWDRPGTPIVLVRVRCGSHTAERLAVARVNENLAAGEGGKP
jgi:type II secretory pathway component PulJ